MATLTISVTGTAVVTGSKAYTVSDADLQALLTWAAKAYGPYIAQTYNPTKAAGFVPTNQQILLAWVQTWINQTVNSVRVANTPPPAPPPPISVS
jgi:hypothetical protein